mmetsp:Transcript_3391/g.5711  ORF Transcript_3391/g.5711 Transcript_3391/m.5711 type:complete len:149 (+) Transcript_3391:1434-1880(+)
MAMYQHLDQLNDQIEQLDTSTMDQIGQHAKELNKTLDFIVKKLRQMNDVNYDKNKIDFLFAMLEKAYESEEHVHIIHQRLFTLEKIHKESPNIEGSIKSLVKRQELIDVTFKHEDSEVAKTKALFMELITGVQQQLKEVTMLQKNKQA